MLVVLQAILPTDGDGNTVVTYGRIMTKMETYPITPPKTALTERYGTRCCSASRLLAASLPPLLRPLSLPLFPLSWI